MPNSPLIPAKAGIQSFREAGCAGYGVGRTDDDGAPKALDPGFRRDERNHGDGHAGRMIEMSDQSELEIEWTTDDSAMVLGPRYHDGKLVSLQVDKQQVDVLVDPVGGGQTRFRFLGAEFGSVGLVSHAIVSDVFAFPIHRSDDPDPAMSEAIHVLNGGMIPLGDIITETRFMLGQHEGLLVFFTCSYGGAFSILCHRMIVTRRGY